MKHTSPSAFCKTGKVTLGAKHLLQKFRLPRTLLALLSSFALTSVFNQISQAQTWKSTGNLADSNWYIVPDGVEEQGRSKSGSDTSGPYATVEYHPASGGNPAYTRLILHSYNPDARFRGEYMLYPQLKSVKGFKGIKGGAVTFEARMRFPVIRQTGGVVVGGIYPYNQDGWDSVAKKVYGQNEIDMEFLHKQLPRNKVWVNTYRDFDGRNQNSPSRLDYFNGYEGTDAFNSPNLIAVTNPSWSNWRTYKMVWSQKKVEWFVDKVRIHKIVYGIEGKPGTDGAVPVPNYDKAMQVFLNIWSPINGSWPQADDSTLQVADSPSNKWYFDVQYVKVTNASQVRGKLK